MKQNFPGFLQWITRINKLINLVLKNWFLTCMLHKWGCPSCRGTWGSRARWARWLCSRGACAPHAPSSSAPSSSLDSRDHTIHINIVSGTTVYVLATELGPPHPFSRKWVPRPLPPPGTKGERHTRLRVRGWECPNYKDWRKSLTLCLFCVKDNGK